MTTESNHGSDSSARVRLSAIGNPFTGHVRFSSRDAEGALTPVMDVISEIHGVPATLRRISVRLSRDMPSSVQGSFDQRTGVIRIRHGSETRRLTFIHELGHALDFFAIGRGQGFGSESGDILIGVMDAFFGTPTGERLVRRSATDDRAAYLIRPREIWARSYAQFIAQQSGNKPLLNQLEIRRRASGTSGLPYTVASEEFGFVADAIAEALEQLGWSVSGK